MAVAVQALESFSLDLLNQVETKGGTITTTTASSDTDRRPSTGSTPTIVEDDRVCIVGMGKFPFVYVQYGSWIE